MMNISFKECCHKQQSPWRVTNRAPLTAIPQWFQPPEQPNISIYNELHDKKSTKNWKENTFIWNIFPYSPSAVLYATRWTQLQAQSSTIKWKMLNTLNYKHFYYAINDTTQRAVEINSVETWKKANGCWCDRSPASYSINWYKESLIGNIFYSMNSIN